jgi:hypothetical protein
MREYKGLNINKNPMEIRDFVQPSVSEIPQKGLRERLSNGALELIIKENQVIDPKEIPAAIAVVLEERKKLIQDFISHAEDAKIGEEEMIKSIAKEVLERITAEQLDEVV